MRCVEWIFCHGFKKFIVNLIFFLYILKLSHPQLNDTFPSGFVPSSKGPKRIVVVLKRDPPHYTGKIDKDGNTFIERGPVTDEWV